MSSVGSSQDSSEQTLSPFPPAARLGEALGVNVSAIAFPEPYRTPDLTFVYLNQLDRWLSSEKSLLPDSILIKRDCHCGAFNFGSFWGFVHE